MFCMLWKNCGSTPEPPISKFSPSIRSIIWLEICSSSSSVIPICFIYSSTCGMFSSFAQTKQRPSFFFSAPCSEVIKTTAGRFLQRLHIIIVSITFLLSASPAAAPNSPCYIPEAPGERQLPDILKKYGRFSGKRVGILQTTTFYCERQ